MATSYRFYHDASLTQEITALNPLAATQATDGSLPAVDTLIYFGSTVTGNKAQVTSNPGVDSIVVSIVDSNAGSGAPASEFKLALSSGALDGAVAGNPLTLTATLNSGVSNAIPIYTRRTSALTVAANHSDISLATQDLTESPV